MRGVMLAIALFAAPSAFAEENTAPPASATGEWVGHVSWNDPIVSYSWAINPDGTFSSGRLGRGHNGGGAWNVNGEHVTLKYDDGFRYEGELHENTYSGSAHVANGRQFGTFVMWRDMKRGPYVAEE